MSDFFPDPDSCPTKEVFPGVQLTSVWLEKVMTCVVDIAPGAVVQEHSHPHEQMGIMLQGEAEFTIGGETRVLKTGDLYRIPSHTKHRVRGLDQPSKAFDVFTPVREEYK